MVLAEHKDRTTSLEMPSGIHYFATVSLISEQGMFVLQHLPRHDRLQQFTLLSLPVSGEGPFRREVTRFLESQNYPFHLDTGVLGSYWHVGVNQDNSLTDIRSLFFSSTITAEALKQLEDHGYRGFPLSEIAQNPSGIFPSGLFVTMMHRHDLVFKAHAMHTMPETLPPHIKAFDRRDEQVSSYVEQQKWRYPIP